MDIISWERNPEDEKSYVEAFNARVLLNRNVIRCNAAKRGLEKLYLNSLWGKFVERQK